MDLRHDQLPWNEQIWAKINADLAHALAQARRVRAPFEVFHVPPATQSIMWDRRDDVYDFAYSDSEPLPIVELAANFELTPSQVAVEGNNFAALDRIIDAAYRLGEAEDELIMNGAASTAANQVTLTKMSPAWDTLNYKRAKLPLDVPIVRWPARRLNQPVGLELYNAVLEGRRQLRNRQRYEPFALFLSPDLEAKLQSTVPGSNSLNTPIERMRPLVTAGIHTSPALADDQAVVVSVARSWVDLAQALEPVVQFLSVGRNGDYRLRLVERFAFRLKDRSARCGIRI